MRPARGVALTVVVTLLTGCAGFGGAESDPTGTDPTPRLVEARAQAAELHDVRLPKQLAKREVRDPGWDSEPQNLDGVFLAPREIGGQLRFTAASSEGTVLWTADRPRSCSGFTLTSDGGRPLAVLTDLSASEPLGGTTASAYDLRTGQQVWGPTKVPGPHAGPGLVFAAPGKAAMGASGPRVALAPATGEVVASEEGAEAPTVVAEHHGMVLTANSHWLRARPGSGGRDAWRIPLSDLEVTRQNVTASLDPSYGEDVALVGRPDGGQSLLDLGDGTVSRTDLNDTALDPATGTRVILGAGELRAFDETDTPLWSRQARPPAAIVSAGDGTLYLREGDTVRALDVMEGTIREVLSGDVAREKALPVYFAADGSAVMDIAGRPYLVTNSLARSSPTP